MGKRSRSRSRAAGNIVINEQFLCPLVVFEIDRSGTGRDCIVISPAGERGDTTLIIEIIGLVESVAVDGYPTTTAGNT